MMRSIQRFFVEVWANDTTRLVLLFTILIILIVVAIYLVQKVRQMAAGGPAEVPDTLTDFREMKEKGLLDEQEFRRVRSVAAPTIHGDKTKQDEKTLPLGSAPDTSGDPAAS